MTPGALIAVAFWGSVCAVVLWGLSYDVRRWLAARRQRREMRRGLGKQEGVLWP